MARRLPHAAFEVPIAVNDNTSVALDSVGREPQNASDPTHVYAANNIVPANSNQSSHLYVQRDGNTGSCFLPAPKGETATERQNGKVTGFKVYSNFPDKLPILPQEIVLIETYLLDLLVRVHANDNEET